MPQNIEIKAHARGFEQQMEKAAELADGPVERIEQEDTFYRTRRGRLKLRIFAEGNGELIFYRRADQAGPKTSSYDRFKTVEPFQLKCVLDGGLEPIGVVRKRRSLYLHGQTRIHLDEVEGLGRFLELEVVLLPGQPESEARREAERLMQVLGIRQCDLIDRAYLDLLLEGESD